MSCRYSRNWAPAPRPLLMKLPSEPADGSPCSNFPNSLLGGEVELAKGVQLGSIDLAFVTGVGLPATLPEIGVFNIPFLFNSAKHAYAVFDGPIGENFLKKFASKEIVALGWGENGVRHITNARHAIVRPDDLKGLKMRVPQSDVLRLGFQAFGAETSLMAFPQLFEALRSGKFDGEEIPSQQYALQSSTRCRNSCRSAPILTIRRCSSCRRMGSRISLRRIS